MKTILATLVVALGCLSTASAEPLVQKPGSHNPAAVADKCKSGCVVLDQEDIATLSAQFRGVAEQAFMAGAEAGHEKGVQDGFEAAKANPKICRENHI